MTGNFKACLDLVLKSEGGWVNNSQDPGGETNFGVTKRVWEEYVGHPLENLKKLTKEEVAPLYELKYWRPCYGEILPRGLDYLCFSFVINSGCVRSIKVLQKSIGVISDGIIVPRVMQKLR